MLKNTLNSLKTRKNSKKGFTLMEMLIVVAIIAILVAIAIPVFTTQLKNARTQVDAANVRSACSMAVTEYLSKSETGAKDYVFAMDANSNFGSTEKPHSIENAGKLASDVVSYS